MNRKKLIIIGVLALAVASLVSLQIFRIVARRVATQAKAETRVVAAARSLEVGATISDADLRIVPAIAEGLPRGVYSQKEEVIGRSVLVPINENELILPTKLASKESGAGLPAMIPEGMRAVSVKVNDVIAVAGFVVPGTHVDVLLTGNPGTGGAEMTTTTVLQNVPVLAAGQKMQRDPSGEPQNVPVITLLVNPEDAQKLTLASSEGRIQLALRNPLDLEETKAVPVRNASLYFGAPAPRKAGRRAPAPPPPSPVAYGVEVIRGDKKDVTKF